jgi:hypothetical protein
MRAVALLLAALALLGAGAPATPTAEWLVDQVRILSAPETEGRSPGTPGAERAGRHIALEMARAGLRPAGDGGTYFQHFPVPTGIRLAQPTRLAVVGPVPRDLALGADWTPLSVSASGAAEAELVFAGYGITASDLGYDDYAGVDVRGRIVLVLGGEPRGADPSSPFRRPEAYHHGQRSHKIINAREHGAAAVLLVPHPSAPSETLPVLAGLAESLSVPAAVVTRAEADRLLAPAGRTLAQLAGAIDGALQPASLRVGGVRVRLEVSLARDTGQTANVIGILPGTDPATAHEAVVIGAHYDHLGRGGEGSMAPDAIGIVHPGADDNASGTAALLGLARGFAGAGGAPRTLVFVAFSGEEMGLLGSAHYVRHPAVPLSATAAMVNLDMVGRLREGRLYVGGVDSGTGLRALVGAASVAGVVPELLGNPHAPSDHTAFYLAGRPVLFLFTGAHEDYHRPSDTWDRINAEGLRHVTAFTAEVVAALARAPSPPVYVRIEAPAPPPRATGRAGYGPAFGIVPGFGADAEAGVRVTGVRPGSPAEQAGVRAGDVIVRFAGMAVRTLEDLTFALRRQRPGDRVRVTLARGGAEHEIEAVLTERSP